MIDEHFTAKEKGAYQSQGAGEYHHEQNTELKTSPQNGRLWHNGGICYLEAVSLQPLMHNPNQNNHSLNVKKKHTHIIEDK